MKINSSKYELLQKQKIEEIQSEGYLLRHRKTGARIVVLENEDDNKVFYVGFRTPSENNTGVAHILEHSVLCGSKKYPVKEPFVELAKGSLNTFLNAMTFPDKTVYPVASCNDKDFKNIMDVYLDAVFNPKIYEREEIFLQEGWHYEIDSPDGELGINGVVYNEMKGAFSSPDGVIARCCLSSLYPDISYGMESGGNPDYIPDLTYEEFKAFHQKLYHPSNSYIYIYGNCDMEERLEYLDKEYLSHYEFLQVESEVKEQVAFDTTKRVEENYSVSAEEGAENKAYFAYNISIGSALDRNLCSAIQILDYALSAPGAPFKQALIDAGLGDDVYTSFENGIKQPMFSVVAKNADIKREQEFVALIKSKLAEIAQNGINKDTLLAGINATEFSYREADFGRYPKGLMYGINLLESWLYDDNEPFLYLTMNETFKFLREKLETRYFEELIEKYFLENTHSSVVVLKPVANLNSSKEEAFKKQLKEYKESLSEDELRALIDKTKALKEFQKTKSTPEELATIPMLKREDIKKEVQPILNSIEVLDGVEVDNHDIYTNGIGYLNLLFDIKNIPDEDIPYVGLLNVVMGYMDTTSHSYEEISNAIDIHTGGIYSDFTTFEKVDGTEFVAKSTIKCKAFLWEMENALELIREMIFDSPYNDHKRLKEILAELKTTFQGRFMSSGHVVARSECLAQFSPSSWYNSRVSGICQYNFLVDLYENFEAKKEEITEKLIEVTKKIFVKDRLFVSFTGAKEDYENFKPQLKKFINNLPDGGYEAAKRNYNFAKCKIGYKIPGMVNYVARCGSFGAAGYEYDPRLRLLGTILSYDYLWDNVRVLGGAYGCMGGFGITGTGYFVSYRDPNLSETNKVYEKMVDFVREFEADDSEMTKYILGTFGDMDAPLNPSAKGKRSLEYYFMGIDEAFLLNNREKMLAANPEDIRALEPIVKAVIDADYVCVIGNGDKITAEQDIFDKVINLV